MTLKRKFLVSVAVLVVGGIVLAALSVWNLVTLYRSARGAEAEYSAMDRADATVAQVVWLRDVLRGPDARLYRDVRYFGPIRVEIGRMVRELELAAQLDDGDGPAELREGRAAADHADAALRRFGGDAGVGPDGKTAADAAALAAAAGELERSRAALAEVSRLVPGSARRHVAGAADRLWSRLAWTCAWLLVVLGASAGAHLAQYRALVRPLLWLRDDMRRSAAAGFLQRVRPRGDREFAEVASVFNGLARDLAELYRTLEEKVVARSRELVRSERLASVGFLAAGVAHEINNPLSVISGYAELAAKGVRRVLTGDAGGGDAGSGGAGAAEQQAAAEAEALGAALDAQSIIRDEAFRCKEITARLLSLARGGSGGREPVRLDELAAQVAVLVKGLKNYRDRRVVLTFAPAPPSPSLEVVANPSELKQVLLNLTVNALEAVAPGRGEVRIGGGRAGEWAELWVEDNGRGMSPQTLEQVFEPFFTAKRGGGGADGAEAGTGLGLSITHAIVENHGGRIRAESDGPGRGSRFVVRLPAVNPAANGAGRPAIEAVPAGATAPVGAAVEAIG